MRALALPILLGAVACATSALANSAVLPEGCCVPAAEDPLHPSALETAAFLFTTGYSKHIEKLVKFKGGDFKKGDVREGPTTTLFEANGLYAVYTWNEGPNHCVFRYQETNEPYAAAQLDFNKLSDRSPATDLSVSGSYVMLTFYGADGVFCSGAGGSDKGIAWKSDGEFHRTKLTSTCKNRYQIKAFDQAEMQKVTASIRYIQMNFCPPLQTPPY